MRIGLFGGTFDPPHFGHLLLAEQCREQCGLDRVLLIPSGQPPHKSSADFSPGKHRVEMLKLAFAGDARFVVDARELTREGTTYTVDTLDQFQQERPDDQLFFLIGADSLNDLPTWREPERILDLATIVAVNRGDRPFPSDVSLIAKVGPERAARVRRVVIPAIDLSSTDIRRRVREGLSIRSMVPRSVEAYIDEHRLYAPGEP